MKLPNPQDVLTRVVVLKGAWKFVLKPNEDKEAVQFQDLQLEAIKEGFNLRLALAKLEGLGDEAQKRTASDPDLWSVIKYANIFSQRLSQWSAFLQAKNIGEQELDNGQVVLANVKGFTKFAEDVTWIDSYNIMISREAQVLKEARSKIRDAVKDTPEAWFSEVEDSSQISQILEAGTVKLVKGLSGKVVAKATESAKEAGQQVQIQMFFEIYVSSSLCRCRGHSGNNIPTTYPYSQSYLKP